MLLAFFLFCSVSALPSFYYLYLSPLPFSHKDTLKMLRGLLCLKLMMCLHYQLHIYNPSTIVFGHVA